jgi:GDP-4-dehydro-6-deoxy-D-mannose reductase
VARIEAGWIPPILKVGNLDTHRALTDVRDMVRALELLAERGEYGEAYNISGMRTYEIREVVDIVRRHAKVPLSIEVDPALVRKSDEKVIFGDSGKLIARTGFRQEIPLETTIADMLEYFRARTV